MTDELSWGEIRHDADDKIRLHWRAQADQALGGQYNVAVMEYMVGAGETVFAVFHPDREGQPSQELYRAVGGGPAIEAAKAAAQQHHNKSARAARWAAYMRDNEPPAVLPPAGAGDPRDPATKDSNCRRCGSCTQWGWCPNCQPTEFNRLP